MTYDVAKLRTHFPALASGAAHFDGPGGSQTPDVVADAIRDTLLQPMSVRGDNSEAARNAERAVVECRAAMADLLNTTPDTIVFGRSMTALTFDVARMLSQSWGPGDEVVVSRLDHDANVRPWVIAAERAGATVRWMEVDAATGELPVEALNEVLSDRTKLVALTAASNLIGTTPDVRAFADAAHAVGALVYVDGVHYTPHHCVDVPASGADFFACSPYKFLGPHCGVVTARRALLEQLRPDKLLPSMDRVPERFELGTLPYELMAGTTAAVDFLADLGGADGSRRARLVESLAQIGEHEDALRRRIEAGIADLPKATMRWKAEHRTPTLLVTFDGVEAAEVSSFLAGRGVNAPAGSFYAIELSRALGLGEAGGLRIGVAPYTDDDDVERLLTGLTEFFAQFLG